MVTIELNDMASEDMKCIEKLRSLGFSDEYIQMLYDLTLRNRKENQQFKCKKRINLEAMDRKAHGGAEDAVSEV